MKCGALGFGIWHPGAPFCMSPDSCIFPKTCCESRITCSDFERMDSVNCGQSARRECNLTGRPSS
jgi:hypothetical protein